MTCHCAYCKKQAARRQLTPAQQAQVAQATALMTANAAARAMPTIDAAPPVPNLVAALNARRAGQPAATMDAPVFGGGVRPYPTVAAAYETIDEPPSLTDAIRNRRAR